MTNNDRSDAPNAVDSLVDSIARLSREIEQLDEHDARRRELVAERDRLRDEASAVAEGMRHPVSVANEIAMLEDRLATIEGLKISKGYNEKHLNHTVQDPGAYSHTINRMLDEEHEAEVLTITERLARLRSIADDGPEDA
jgi:hypothetical protein